MGRRRLLELGKSSKVLGQVQEQVVGCNCSCSFQMLPDWAPMLWREPELERARRGPGPGPGQGPGPGLVLVLVLEQQQLVQGQEPGLLYG